MKKILIGCPVSDHHQYCTEDYLKALQSLSYPSYHILLIDNSKSSDFSNFLKKQNIPVLTSPHYPNPRKRIITSRNLLRQHILDNNYDYFLSLEQDVIPPKDIIERAISHKKDILTGVYCGNMKIDNQLRILPLVYKFPPKSRTSEATSLIQNSNLEELKKTHSSYLDMVKAYYTIEELESQPSPTKVHSCGLGCVLISKKVLENIEFRYSEKYGGWDDVWFCEDAKKQGFEIYVDPTIRCKHLIKNRPWNWEDLLRKK